MPRILRRLKINDISSVDVGAGRGVSVMLTKRDVGKVWSSNNDLPEGVKASLPSEAQSVFRRVANDRMKGGASDESAIKQAWSAVKNGWEKKGDDWVRKQGAAKDEDLGKGDFDDAYAAIEAREDAGGLMHEVSEAICALNASVCSILDDEEVIDKAAAIAASFTQFKDHVAGLGLGEHEESEMNKQEIEALVGDAVTKAVSEKDHQIKSLQDALIVAKMSDKHRAFFTNMKDGDAKKKFADASDDEREELMNSTRKRYDDDPIYKAMREENEDLKKRIEKIEDAGKLEICKREARDMGVTAENAGDVRLRVKKGDADALVEWETMLAAANESLRKSNKQLGKQARAFEEIGDGRGSRSASGSAYDELVAKAQELRKLDPKLTVEKAYAKAIEDPSNRELVKRESEERMDKIHGVRAA